MGGTPKSPNPAPNLIFRRPNCTLLEETLSTTGKYLIYLGTHYEGPHPCWVVGAVSKVTGIRSERHLHDGIVGCIAPKATAYAMWDEFKQEMTRPAREEEDELEGLEEHIQNKKQPHFFGDPKPNPWEIN